MQEVVSHIGIGQQVPKSKKRPLEEQKEKEVAVEFGRPKATQEIKSKVLEYCKHLRFPRWNKVSEDPDSLEVHVITGGLTNELYLCSLKNTEVSDEPRHLVLRIYGRSTNTLLDRTLEVKLSSFLSENKIGPKIFDMFSEGRFEEFLPGRALFRTEMKDPAASKPAGRMLGEMHSLTVDIDKSPMLTKNLDNWWSKVKSITHFEDPDKEKVFASILERNIGEELRWLKEAMEWVNSPIVFCHNDLQAGNIIKAPHNNHGNHDHSLTFIDFEYGGYNYRGFDFGNHFCEWALENAHPVYPFFDLQIQDYPTKEQQIVFFRSYLEGRNEVPPKEKESQIFDKMHLEANLFALGSSFMWTLWGIIQAYNVTSDFDYIRYAQMRWNMYFQQKKSVLALLPQSLQPKE